MQVLEVWMQKYQKKKKGGALLADTACIKCLKLSNTHISHVSSISEGSR